jgi:hypothetical protein
MEENKNNDEDENRGVPDMIDLYKLLPKEDTEFSARWYKELYPLFDDEICFLLEHCSKESLTDEEIKELQDILVEKNELRLENFLNPTEPTLDENLIDYNVDDEVLKKFLKVK